MNITLLFSESRINLPPDALFKEKLFRSIYATRLLLSSSPPDKPFSGGSG